jgi:hypothetical protein
MGYCATAFAVNIQAIRNVFGSKDETLLQKAKNTGMHRCYAGQHPEGLLDQCLQDIIFNYVSVADRKPTKKFFGLMTSDGSSGLNHKLGSEYAYCLMMISEAIGIDLCPEGDIFHISSADETNEFLKEKGFKITFQDLENPQSLFDLPKIQTWPVIHSFSKDETKYLYQELCNLQLNPDDDESDLDVEILIYWRDKLKICIDNDLEWLSFTH